MSVGIAVQEAGSQESAEQLLRNADLAMYQAKSIQSCTYALYDPEMHAISSSVCNSSPICGLVWSATSSSFTTNHSLIFEPVRSQDRKHLSVGCTLNAG